MVDLNLAVPEQFMEEEVRDGYIVSSQVKKVWAIELDLLAELLNVCKKHNIKILACGGTLLGAVRHKGFIPWDDDIDMMMFREDYDRLCEVAGEEFNYPYFFQTEYSDPGSMRCHAQLRNSRTTGILQGEMEIFNFNQGIFIDIFPLDKVPDDDKEKEKYLTKIRKKKKILFLSRKITARYRSIAPREGKGILKGIVRLIFILVDKIFSLSRRIQYQSFENFLKKYNHCNVKNAGLLFFLSKKDRMICPIKSLMETIDVSFEMLTVPIPKEYNDILEINYGDWKTPVINPSMHGNVIFDVDKPYTFYVKKQFK